MEEVSRLMATLRGRMEVRMLFESPASIDSTWSRSDLWRAAGRLAGASRLLDQDGREAALFGARTSGHAVLYGTDGRLVFSGGLTPARGHAGASAGSRAVAAVLRAEATPQRQAAVFGCPLFDDRFTEACGGQSCP
jgi:hypothetical protein